MKITIPDWFIYASMCIAIIWLVDAVILLVRKRLNRKIEEEKERRREHILNKGKFYSVIPTLDADDHSNDITCKCKPTIYVHDGCNIIVHNSFDGREAVEWAKDILNKDGNGSV